MMGKKIIISFLFAAFAALNLTGCDANTISIENGSAQQSINSKYIIDLDKDNYLTYFDDSNTSSYISLGIFTIKGVLTFAIYENTEAHLEVYYDDTFIDNISIKLKADGSIYTTYVTDEIKEKAKAKLNVETIDNNNLKFRAKLIDISGRIYIFAD